jgi:glycine cleavage system aminomethyltransferase T
MIPAVSAAAYDAARRRAGFVDRSDRGRIVVSGADRASYLQGLVTNDVVALKAGQGCYSAYLTAQGRMIADLHIYELGDVLLLAMTGDVKGTVLAKLDQFIFSEDVQLGDVSDTFTQVAVVGPDAAHVVATVLGGVTTETLTALAADGNVRTAWTGGAAIVTRVVDTGEPGFDLFVDRAHAGALRSALAAAGAMEIDEATAEAIRIEAGVPLFHRDMDEETIPLEAGIARRSAARRSAATAAGHGHSQRRPRSRRGDEQHGVTSAAASDCARLRASRVHRAGDKAVGRRHRRRSHGATLRDTGEHRGDEGNGRKRRQRRD